MVLLEQLYRTFHYYNNAKEATLWIASLAPMQKMLQRFSGIH
jgi:hypothetical protein